MFDPGTHTYSADTFLILIQTDLRNVQTERGVNKSGHVNIQTTCQSYKNYKTQLNHVTALN